jgi:hypothetical protein
MALSTSFDLSITEIFYNKSRFGNLRYISVAWLRIDFPLANGIRQYEKKDESTGIESVQGTA